jgi:hypothetical protein
VVLAVTSGKGTGSSSQLRTSLITALNSTTAADLKPSNVIIAPVQYYGSTKGYVVARNKCSSTSCSTGVDEILTPPNLRGCDLIDFSDTDSILLGFIAVTCGIALKQVSNALSPSLPPSRHTSLRENTSQPSIVLTEGMDNSLLLEYARSLLIAKSCTAISRCRSLSEVNTEVRSLFRSLFASEYVTLFEVKVDNPNSSSRVLYLQRFGGRSEGSSLRLPPSSEITMSIKACASKQVCIAECNEDDQQLFQRLQFPASSPGALICPLYFETSEPKDFKTDAQPTFCALLILSLPSADASLSAEGEVSTLTTSRTRGNSIATATTNATALSLLTGTTLSNSAVASLSGASSVSTLTHHSSGHTTGTISATPSQQVGPHAGSIGSIRAVVSITGPCISTSVSNILSSALKASTLALLEHKFNIVNNALFALSDYVLILNSDGMVMAANAGMESFLRDNQEPNAIRAKSAKSYSNLPGKENPPDSSNTRYPAGIGRNNSIGEQLPTMTSPRSPGGGAPRYFLDSDEELSSICGFHYSEFIHDTLCPQLVKDLNQSLSSGSSHNAQTASVHSSSHVSGIFIDYSVFAIDSQGVISQSDVTMSVGKDTLVFSWDETIEDLCEGGTLFGGDDSCLPTVCSGTGGPTDGNEQHHPSLLCDRMGTGIPSLPINSNATTMNNNISVQNTNQPHHDACSVRYEETLSTKNGSTGAPSSSIPAKDSTGDRSVPASQNIDAVVVIIKPIRNSNPFLETIRKYSNGSALEPDDDTADIDVASRLMLVANSLLESCSAQFRLASEHQQELAELCVSLVKLTRAVKKQETIGAQPNYSSMYSCRDLHAMSMPSNNEPTVHSSLFPSLTDSALLVSSAFHPPETLFTWDFNALEVTDKGVLNACIGRLFEEMINLSSLGVDVSALSSYISVISRNYHENPFHNFSHAATVCHVVYKLMETIQVRQFLSPMKIFCVLLSCLVHDVDHPGNTNGFEVNCGSELAIRYNDQSVLENHHCSTAFRLMRKPGLDITKNLKSVVATDIRKTVISCVLATDMALHFAFVEELKKFAVHAKEVSQRSLLYSDQPNVLLLCKTLVHAADLSNPVRRFPVTRRWAELIATEFNAQVSKEEELGLPILGFMVSKDLKMICKNEMGFSSFVVAPMWRCLETILPELHFLVTQMDANQAEWKAIIDKLEEEEEEEDDKREKEEELALSRQQSGKDGEKNESSRLSAVKDALKSSSGEGAEYVTNDVKSGLSARGSSVNSTSNKIPAIIVNVRPEPHSNSNSQRESSRVHVNGAAQSEPS